MTTRFIRILGLLCLFAATLTALAAPATVWVNSAFGPGNCAGHTWEVDAFATVQAGVDAVDDHGVVWVALGTYSEAVTITTNCLLLGPGAQLNPNDPTQLLPTDVAFMFAQGFPVLTPPPTMLADDITVSGIRVQGEVETDEEGGEVELLGFGGRWRGGVTPNMMQGLAPTAVNDSYTTLTEETTFTRASNVGVLVNDYEAFGAELHASLVSGPAHGTLTIFGTWGGFEYVPNTDYYGTDSFTYRCRDEEYEWSNTATVSLQIAGVNDPPVNTAAPSISGTAQVGQVLTASAGTWNDTKDAPNAGTITYTYQWRRASSANGTYSDITGATASTYTLAGADNGNYVRVHMTATDNNYPTPGQSATADSSAVGPVQSGNHNPVATADTYSTNEDTPLSVSAAGVLTNDTDQDNDALTATLMAGPSHAASFTLNSNGSFSYTPASNYFGTDSFTYTAVDTHSAESAATAVTLNVASVNDPPVAQANAYSVNEDATLTVSAPGVLANDTDVENDALTAVLVAGPAHAASFTLNANGSFSYTPAPNYFGADSFTYHAQDSHDAYSSVVAVTLTVQSVNDPPVAHADAYTTNIETMLTVVAPGLLQNDTDPDNDTLAAALVTGPAHAAANGFTLNANGSFSYTPAPTYLGTDSFTYQVSDGHGGTATTVVTITVHANTDPTAVDDACTVAKDSTANALAVLANDIDPDNDILTVASVSLALHGTTAVSADHLHAVYTPAPHFFGQDVFRYQVSDHHTTAWATVWVTVENTTNDAPHAYPMTIHSYEDIAISIRLLADDYDGDELTYSITSQPAHGTVALTGDTARYTPSANYFGLDGFVFQVNDGHSHTATATVTLTIDPLNDPPSAENDSVTVLEDSANNTINVLANDSCAPDSGETLTVTAVTQPYHGTVTLTGGVVKYTPAPHYFGPDAFWYTLSDGHDYSTSTALVSVNVTKVNLGPTAVNDSVVVDEDTEDNALDVLANDTDPEGDALTITAVGTPQHGTATTDGTTISYTPAPDYYGLDTFTYTISDGTVTAVDGVTVQVLDVPDLSGDQYPVAVTDAFDGLLENMPNLLDVLANDYDPDLDPLTITAVTQPEHGTVVFTATGVTYTPATYYFGPDTFTYTIRDPQGATATTVVTLTVDRTADDAAPTAGWDLLCVPMNGTGRTLNVLANDLDPESDALTLSLPGETDPGYPAHGTLTLVTATGQPDKVRYTPAPNYFGLDEFTYSVSDGHGGTATGSVSVLVYKLSVGVSPGFPVPGTTPARWAVPVGDAGQSVRLVVMSEPAGVDFGDMSVAWTGATVDAEYPPQAYLDQHQTGATSVGVTVTDADSETISTSAQVVVVGIDHIVSDSSILHEVESGNATNAVTGVGSDPATVTVKTLVTPSTPDVSAVYDKLLVWLSSTGAVGSTPDRWTVTRTDPVEAMTTVRCGASQDTLDVWAVQVKLNLGGVADADKLSDEHAMQLLLNSNDDNKNGIADLNESNGVQGLGITGETDLTLFSVTLRPAGVPVGTVTLDVPNALAVCDESDKRGGRISAPVWDLADGPLPRRRVSRRRDIVRSPDLDGALRLG